MADLIMRLYKNKMVIVNMKKNKEDILIPSSPFSNDRLLIASMVQASNCLRAYLEKNVKGILKPKITIIPLEIVTNDFSEADELAILTFAYKAGAREVILKTSE